MIIPKIAKLILEELDLKYEQPFNIEGHRIPYRLTKKGEVEKFKNGIWDDSSYGVYDIALFADSKQITKNNDKLVEYIQESRGKKRR